MMRMCGLLVSIKRANSPMAKFMGLAEQGYVAVSADATYQGASGVEPRQVDKPASRIEDTLRWNERNPR